MLLKNKVAVIHGAAGAIGSAVARAFGREGARLFLGGRTLARVEEVAREIVAGGGKAEASQVDALDGDAVEAYTSNAIARAGHIDIVFNAIGFQAIQGTPLIDLDSDDFIAPIVTGTTSQFLTS